MKYGKEWRPFLPKDVIVLITATEDKLHGKYMATRGLQEHYTQRSPGSLTSVLVYEKQ